MFLNMYYLYWLKENITKWFLFELSVNVVTRYFSFLLEGMSLVKLHRLVYPGFYREFYRQHSKATLTCP